MRRKASLAGVALCVVFLMSIWSAPGLGAVSGAVSQRRFAESRLSHDLRVIESWSRRTNARFYAGSYYLPRNGGQLVVGFTRRPRAQFAVVRQIPGIWSPPRLVLRKPAPRYSLLVLKKLDSEVAVRLPEGGPLSRLVLGIRVDVMRNAVVATTEDTKALKKVVDRLFGRNAPIHVEWAARSVHT
jgi:hypothetical protein